MFAGNILCAQQHWIGRGAAILGEVPEDILLQFLGEFRNILMRRPTGIFTLRAARNRKGQRCKDIDS